MSPPASARGSSPVVPVQRRPAVPSPSPADAAPSTRRALPGILVVTGLAYLPALGTGLFGDDYWWILGLSADTPGVGPYRISYETPAVADFWTRHGVHPWWASSGFHWALLRPLSDALLGVAWRAFGTSPLPWQLVTLAAYLGLVVVVARLFRRLVEPPVATAATFVFATHFSHLQCVWWVANAHTVLAAAFAGLGLEAWWRWREEGWKPGFPLAVAGLALGLATSETALAALVFGIAGELAPRGAGSGARSSRTGRMVAIVAMVATAALYVVMHGALGYGLRHSGGYADPRSDLSAWLAQAVTQAPALVSGALDLVPADAWLFMPQARPAIVLAACLGTATLGGLLRAAWPELDARARRGVAVAALGAVGSLPLVLGAPPGGRLVLWTTLGTALLVASAVVPTVRAWRRGAPLSLTRRALTALLLLGLAAMVPADAARLHAVAALAAESRAAATSAALDDIADAEVVAVTAGDALEAIYVLPTRLVELGTPAPRGFTVLSPAVADHRLTRTAPDRLELEVLGGGGLWSQGFARVFLSRTDAPRRGVPWSAPGLVATVLAEGDDGPTKVAFQFPAPLDDPRYRFVAWQDGALRPLALPPVGSSTVIPWSFAPLHASP